jgi:hypothetical protein
MRHRALTRTEAEEICDRYQYLIGLPFGKNQRNVIECVAVTPYEDPQLYIFLLNYRECRNAEQALRLYTGNTFEVMVITTLVSDKVQVFQKDLRSYLQEIGASPILQHGADGAGQSPWQNQPTGN